MLDPVKVEAAEKQIDSFIASRARERSEANRIEAAWAETTRRYNEKRRREHRELWLDFHLGQAERLRRTMTALIESHEKAAAQLLEESGQQ